MTTADIFDGMNEVQRLEMEKKMLQKVGDKSTFTSKKPSTTSPPSPEPVGSIAFTAATESARQNNDAVSVVQSQRIRGEKLVNEAHKLNHRAMIARTQGDYETAEKLQREAIILQQKGHAVLSSLQMDKNELGSAMEKMNSKEVSFGSSLSMTQCEKACAKQAKGVHNTYILGHW